MKILEDNSKALFATTYIALLVGAAALGLSAIPRTTQAATSPVGIVIPLYTYPTDGTWTAVIQAKQSYPNVPFIAVINPNSGPGTSPDPAYAQGIKDLQAAGITVLGYVATGYGSNSLSSVESQVSAYKSWYAVNGIMFDEMSSQVGYESYYSTLDSYVHSLIPGSLTVGNPGTSVPTSFIGTLDVLCIYEDAGYPSLSFITYPGYSPSNFATIVFGVPLNTSFLTSLSGLASWAYVTDANLPNPYDVLPSYFTTEVAALSTIDLTSTTTSTSTTGTSATVSVNSVDLSGNPIAGMWTTWSQNGATLATGYTPATFTGTTGGTYVLTVANYLNTVFCHWQNGNTNSSLSLMLGGSLSETAYYSTSGSCPAPSATYPVTFTESGLATGTQWSVTFNGVASTSTSTSIVFDGIAAGTYSWSAGSAGCGTGCQFASSPSSGTLSVTGSTAQSVTFAKQYLVSMAASPSNGGSTSPAAGSGTWVNAGASIPVSASPASGYAFASWTSTGSISISSATSPSTTATVSGPGTLTAGFSSMTAAASVQSATLSGSSLSGMWTTWSQGGVQLSAGYTPTSFTGTVGQSYVVAVSNYGSTVFCHWQDGSTNPQRTVSLSANVALTAYYSATGSCTTNVSVTIVSKSVGGFQFTGMWLEVTSNGTTVASGYTTLTFTATVGQSYTITMSNWKNYVFAYWDDGSTNPTRTVTPSQATALTAFYDTGHPF